MCITLSIHTPDAGPGQSGVGGRSLQVTSDQLETNISELWIVTGLTWTSMGVKELGSVFEVERMTCFSIFHILKVKRHDG